jgi:hypothetical protein
MDPVISFGSPAGPALGSALHALAVDALARGIGEPLSTNAQYQSEYQLGAGTIQRALSLLAERGALRTTSHGHQGRRVQDLAVGPLWQLGGLAPVRLVLPPEGPEEMDNLQEALSQGLADLGIPHTVQHLPGGLRRLAAVRAGDYDICVTSAGAAESARIDGPDDRLSRVTRVLDRGTYYGEGSLVCVRRSSPPGHGRPQRVAIDPESPDHVALTMAEFPAEEGVTTYVDTPFTNVPAAVLRNDVEVGIWHRQDSIIPLDLAGLSTAPMQRREARTVWEKLSSAVLTGWPGRPELAAVLVALNIQQKP